MHRSRMAHRRHWLLLLSVAVGLLTFLDRFPQSVPVAHAASPSFDPTFTVGRPFGSRANVNQSLAAGDMNNDGFIDLIIASSASSAVYLNDGAGNFYADALDCVAPPDSVRCFGGAGSSVMAVQAADINGDGLLDIIVGDQNVVYLNDPAHPGNFATGPPDCAAPLIRCFGSRNLSVLSIAVGDMNGDGAFDIVVGRSDGLAGEPSAVYLNSNTGGTWGHFDTSPVDCAAPAPHTRCFGATALGARADMRGIAVADINGDHSLDIVASNDASHPPAIYLNNGSGSFFNGAVACQGTFQPNVVCFGTSSALATIGMRQLAVGDINRDARPDLVVGLGQQIVIYLNSGMATPFATGAVNCADPWLRCLGSSSDPLQSVSLGDLNSDGALDVIVGRDTQDHVYLNDGSGAFLSGGIPFGTGTDATVDALAVDVNGDGALDLATTSWGQSMVYLNNQSGAFQTGPLPAFGMAREAVAVADLNGDHALDIITNGGSSEAAWIYLNDRTGNFYRNSTNCVAPAQSSVRCLSIGTLAATRSLAVGDLNGDGALDVITGNDSGQIVIFLNDSLGQGNFYQIPSMTPLNCAAVPANVRCLSGGAGAIKSLATGDLDGDGNLDLVVGRYQGQSAVYLNDGAANFTMGALVGGSADLIDSVAIGDLNGGGALDIAVGNGAISSTQGMESKVYLNDGAGNFSGIGAARPFGMASDDTRAIALGDLNGDGALDIAVGNHGFSYGQQNLIYLNDGAGNFNWPGAVRLFGSGSDRTTSLAICDLNGDGALDLIVGNEGLGGEQSAVYLNDGAGNFSWPNATRPFGIATDQMASLAAGDIDGNGTPDIVANTLYLQQVSTHTPRGAIYLNHTRLTTGLPNIIPTVTIERPGKTANAGFLSTREILAQQRIPISYTIAQRDGDPADRVVFSYSLDGGGRWFPALATSATQTHDLAPGAHVFTWDTFASGVFGESDSVVVRVQVYPAIRPSLNGVPGPYQWPDAVATTFPFRVRGTQVRVIHADGSPVPGALVYRSGRLLSGGVRTDTQGYLPGRGTLQIGDGLLAVAAISTTDSFTRYITSARVGDTSLELSEVATAGVQTLTISPDNSLILFNLSLSLEWDARNDNLFMAQLRADLHRTSDLLYAWSNGQMALGSLHIYYDKAHWDDAHIRIYASNRLRPNASQGGIVSAPMSETVVINGTQHTVTYTPGQVHIGATWTRFGDPVGKIGEDWPRTLAHELAHYALFLDDNYLGQDAAGRLIPVESCPGVMSDYYDATGGKFRTADNWLPDCEQTLANRTVGRADWMTIKQHYDQPDLGFALHAPATFGAGPNLNGVPLEIPSLTETVPTAPATTLSAPFFYLTHAGIRFQPSSAARAFLFSADGSRISDLGRPSEDRVAAYGAHSGDRLCVYDLSAGQIGCETIRADDVYLELANIFGWRPQVVVTPTSLTTVTISVENIVVTSTLRAQIYPDTGAASAPIPLQYDPTANRYTGSIQLAAGAGTLDGYVHIRVDEPGNPRELVVDYSAGGGPGRMHSRRAPAISGDGQATLFNPGSDVQPGDFYTFQSVTDPPAMPSWFTVIGNAYRLSASANAPALTGASLNIAYLGTDVPPGEESEQWLKIYYSDGTRWQPLPTNLDTDHNEASALISGPGIYALLSSLPLQLSGPGWNHIPFPVAGTRLLTETLLPLSGSYTTVYECLTTEPTDPWRLYDVDAPSWVNDLKKLEFGHSYWINVTKEVTLYLRGQPRITAALASAGSCGSLPPATYYGVVHPVAGFVLAADMPVKALVGEHICGQGQTRLEDGQLVYAVDVASRGPGMDSCAAWGDTVRFQVGTQTMPTSVRWDNSRPTNLSLGPGGQQRSYLPLVQRGR